MSTDLRKRAERIATQIGRLGHPCRIAHVGPETVLKTEDGHAVSLWTGTLSRGVFYPSPRRYMALSVDESESGVPIGDHSGARQVALLAVHLLGDYRAK